MTQDVFYYWIENGFIPKLAPAADRGHVVLLLNTFRAGLIEAVCKKQLILTWLCG